MLTYIIMKQHQYRRSIGSNHSTLIPNGFTYFIQFTPVVHFAIKRSLKTAQESNKSFYVILKMKKTFISKWVHCSHSSNSTILSLSYYLRNKNVTLF